MNTLLVLIRKEFLQLKRDRKMLPLVLVAPVLQLVLLGFAADLDVRQIPAGLVDNDPTSASRRIVRQIEEGDLFVFVEEVGMPAEAESLLVSGRADVVFVIPRGFTEGRLIQVLVDGTNSTVGTAAINYVNGILGTAYDALPPIEVRTRVWFNPSMETRNFMVPGILSILLMLITTVLSSLAIVKEKELGTLEQINVTPISATQMIVGKLVPFAILGIIDVVLVLLVSQVIFRVPLNGSPFLIILASLLFLGSTLGLGLLVSTIAENQQQAMLTASFFVMIPMFFLSGFAFPLESMPMAVRWISYGLPLRYYLIIIRAVFLKGAGLSVLGREFLILAVFGILITALAAFRTRRSR